GVFGRAREISAHCAVFEKNGATGIAAFDGAIEIVPLIDPTNASVGLLEFIEIENRLMLSYFAEQEKYAIENAAIIFAGDNEMTKAMNVSRCEPKSVCLKTSGRMKTGDYLSYCAQS